MSSRRVVVEFVSEYLETSRGQRRETLKNTRNKAEPRSGLRDNGKRCLRCNEPYVYVYVSHHEAYSIRSR
jgi:hypothetical protein